MSVLRACGLGLLAAVAAGRAPDVSACPAADTVLVTRHVASFDRAASVSVDPTGRIVVADEGQDAVLRLSAAGDVLEAVGGPGSDVSRFDDPAGIDATNGLILLVADTGNGRIQRFARDGRFLELLPVSADPAGRTDAPVYLEGDVRSADRSDGRPVDVVSTDDGRVFAVESVSGTLRTWDRERRTGAAIGAAVGDAFPLRPRAVATDGERVFVADVGLPGIAVLDRFGRPFRTFGHGTADGLVGVAWGDGCVWMVLTYGIAAFSPEGTLVGIYESGLESPLVDAAVREGTVYLLTRGALYAGVATCPLRAG